MRVLVCQHDRAAPALPQEEPLDGVERPRTPLPRLELVPPAVRTRRIEQAQKRRHRLGQIRIEAQHPLADPPPDRLGILVLDPEVRLQQIDDRQVRRPARDRHRARLEQETRPHVRASRELPQQPGLADPRLPHERDELALAPHRGRPAAPEQVPLLAPADEGDPAPLEPEARRLRAEQAVRDWPAVVGPARGIQLEASREERLRGRARQDRPRLGVEQQRTEDLGGLVRRASADLMGPGDASDHLLAGVQRELDGLVRADSRRAPIDPSLDRQGGERGAARGLVDRLEAERRVERRLAQRIQPPAEAEHLFGREVQSGIPQPGIVGLLRPPDHGPQEGDPAPLPANRGRLDGRG